MRAVTLSDDRVIKDLKKNFVVVRKNIAGKTSYAGTSNTHLPTYAAMCVNNSSGHHNVQMFIMTQDGRVLHCLPGFWHPDHLIAEMGLAKNLGKLYYKKGISTAKRNELFLNMHLEQALKNDKRMRNSSKLQGFDANKMKKKEGSDFKRTEGFIKGKLKTADQVMHERMAALPFIKFERFNVKKYIDMGLKRYKYDYGVPGKDKYAKKKKSSEKKKKSDKK